VQQKSSIGYHRARLKIVEDARVLVVDDEESIRHMLSLSLSKDGFSVWTASSATEALQMLQKGEGFQFCVTDIRMPGMDGLAFIQEAQRLGKQCPTFVAMSAYGDKQLALEALRRGAFDYISKPFEPAELALKLGMMVERNRLSEDQEPSKLSPSGRASRPPTRLSDIVTGSAPMEKIAQVVRKVASFPTTLLLTGETGTGKERIAAAIHSEGRRSNRPFIAVNCAAIPANLIESELFGHRKGAFTDASQDRKGLFEQADGGTLLLDEIGELPINLQVKLLRVLVEEEIRPLGANTSIPIDVRVVAATSRDLPALIRDGRFREDLFHRLNVLSIEVPPLRKRREDIRPLITHFCQKFEQRLHLLGLALSEEAIKTLENYDWPGNVRELENALERAFVLADGPKITISNLDDRFFEENDQFDTLRPNVDPASDLKLKPRLGALEHDLLKAALLKSGGNRSQAAQILGISQRALLYKLKEHGLT
jgi:two-component system response regulator AtoC